MILIVFDECNTDAKVRPFCFSERRLTEWMRYKFVKSDTDEAGVDFLVETLNNDFILNKVSLHNHLRERRATDASRKKHERM